MAISYKLVAVLNDNFTDIDNNNSRVDGYYTNTITPVFEKIVRVKKIQMLVYYSNNMVFASEKLPIEFSGNYMFKTFDLGAISNIKEYSQHIIRVKLFSDTEETEGIELEVKNSSGTFNRWRKTRRPIFENIELTGSALSPFKLNNNFTFNKFYGDDDIYNLSTYAITHDEDNNFLIGYTLSSNNESYTGSTTCSIFEENEELLNFSIPGSEVLEAYKNFDFSNGAPTINLTLTITNNHGVLFSSQPIEVRPPKTPVISFSDATHSLRFKNVKVNNSTSTSASYAVPDIFTKGCKLSINGIKVKSLYPLSQLEVSAVKGEVVRTYILDNQSEPTDFEYTINLNGGSEENDYPLIEITENFTKNIAHSNHHIDITVTNTQNGTATKDFNSEDSVDKSVKSMIPGNGEIVQTIFDANGNLSLTLRMDDYGVNSSVFSGNINYMTFSARLYYFDQASSKWKGANYLHDNNLVSQNNLYSLNNISTLADKGSSVKIKIKCKTRLWPLGKNNTYNDTTKHAVEFTYELGEMVITRGNPTFSYRKNRIGVNYNFPSTESDTNISTAILVANQTEDYNKIIFKGNSNSIVFNLSNQTVNNLIIDCGTWS